MLVVYEYQQLQQIQGRIGYKQWNFIKAGFPKWFHYTQFSNLFF